jgi:hypothetical protein
MSKSDMMFVWKKRCLNYFKNLLSNHHVWLWHSLFFFIYLDLDTLRQCPRPRIEQWSIFYRVGQIGTANFKNWLKIPTNYLKIFWQQWHNTTRFRSRKQWKRLISKINALFWMVTNFFPFCWNWSSNNFI